MLWLLCLCAVAGLLPDIKARPLEDDVRMSFKVTGQELTLNMKRNTHIDPNVPVYIGQEGQISRWKSSKDDAQFAAYIDNEKGASFVIREEQGNPSYTGSFHFGGVSYVMEPAHRANGRDRRSLHDVNLRHLTPVDHVIYKSEEAPDYEADYRFKPELADRYSFNIDDIPSSFAVSENYCVEMLLILDYALYKEFYGKYGSHDSAIRELKYFYAHVVNGIDQRYLSINDFSIHVRMVALYITTTAEDSHWTMASHLHSPGDPFGWTDAYQALDAMEDWVPTAETMFPTFDQMTLFTGNSLYGSIREDGSYRSIGGLANIGAICTPTRVAINQFSMVYPTIQTGAHEMGHNLGAQHDGTGNTCTSRDQYVMANSPGMLKDTNYLHPYQFSTCSKKYIRDLLLNLQYREENCLLNMAEHINQDQMEADLRKLPGQVYTLDEQCQQMKGPNSFHCAGGKHEHKMCIELECYDTKEKRCMIMAEQRAAEGTTCGNHKWCKKAECVYDAAAPEAPDECIYGDWLGEFQFEDGHYTCERLVRELPWNCYMPDYSVPCCRSCGDLKDPSKPGCEYGDHHKYCQETHTRPGDCYSENNQKTCCAACEKLKGNNPDCLYGDRASWCATIEPSGCYGNAELCCDTCPRLDSGNPECPWGDRASWCSQREAFECYGELRDNCCDFCQRHHTGIPGCEYGDRSRYCVQQDCDDPSRHTTCCYTCGDKQTVPTTARTTKPTQQPPPEDCKDTAEWCATMPLRDCYVSAHTCCRRCADNKQNVPGCEWGDKVSWCAEHTSNCANLRDDCCQTCK